MALNEIEFDEYIQQIKEAIYGEEVRGSIVGALEYANAGLSILAQLPASSSIISVDLYADMTEPNKIYLYTGEEQNQYPGYWYYHNGTQFVPGAEFDPTASGSFWFYVQDGKMCCRYVDSDNGAVVEKELMSDATGKDIVSKLSAMTNALKNATASSGESKVVPVSGDNIANLNTAFNANRKVICAPNSTFNIYSRPADGLSNTSRYLYLEGNQDIDLNGSTIVCSMDGHPEYFGSLANFIKTDETTGYNGNSNIIMRNGTLQNIEVLLAHGQNITFENMVFRNLHSTHFFQIMSCRNVTIRNCRFENLIMPDDYTSTNVEAINLDQPVYAQFPYFASAESGAYDNTRNHTVNIIDNVFTRGTNYRMDDACCAHAADENTLFHVNVNIRGNRIYNAAKAGIRLSACSHVMVSDNFMSTAEYAVTFRNVDNVLVSNNLCVGSNSNPKFPAWRRFDKTKITNLYVGSNGLFNLANSYTDG